MFILPQDAFNIGKAIADYKYQKQLELWRQDPLRQAQSEWYKARAETLIPAEAQWREALATQAIPTEAEWRRALTTVAIPAEAEWRRAMANVAIPAEASYYGARAKEIQTSIDINQDWFNELISSSGLLDIWKSLYSTLGLGGSL